MAHSRSYLFPLLTIHREEREGQRISFLLCSFASLRKSTGAGRQFDNSQPQISNGSTHGRCKPFLTSSVFSSKSGELIRVKTRVSPMLEIAAISDRVCKTPAPHGHSELERNPPRPILVARRCFLKTSKVRTFPLRSTRSEVIGASTRRWAPTISMPWPIACSNW